MYVYSITRRVCITLYNYTYIVTAKIFCNKLYFEIGYHNQYMNIYHKGYAQSLCTSKYGRFCYAQ